MTQGLTRGEFVEKFRHELAGLYIDAITQQRTGAELAFYIRQLMHKCDKLLGTFYDAAKGIPEPPKPLPPQPPKGK